MQNRLIDFQKGDRVKIIEIHAGRGSISNLISLGLNVGNIVEIGKKSRFHGPVIVIYRETEIAVGYGLAEKIIVEGA